MVDTRFSVSLQIMLTLAAHGEELTNSQLLAHVLKTNPTFVRKLTSRLVEAGLVQSFRGKNGGMKLGRPAQDIRLDEIYAVATAEKPLARCPDKPATKACKVSCAMGDIFGEVVGGMEEATRSYLGKRKLSDLLKRL